MAPYDGDMRFDSIQEHQADFLPSINITNEMQNERCLVEDIIVASLEMLGINQGRDIVPYLSSTMVYTELVAFGASLTQMAYDLRVGLKAMPISEAFKERPKYLPIVRRISQATRQYREHQPYSSPSNGAPSLPRDGQGLSKFGMTEHCDSKALPNQQPQTDLAACSFQARYKLNEISRELNSQVNEQKASRVFTQSDLNSKQRQGGVFSALNDPRRLRLRGPPPDALSYETLIESVTDALGSTLAKERVSQPDKETTVGSFFRRPQDTPLSPLPADEFSKIKPFEQILGDCPTECQRPDLLNYQHSRNIHSLSGSFGNNKNSKAHLRPRSPLPVTTAHIFSGKNLLSNEAQYLPPLCDGSNPRHLSIPLEPQPRGEILGPHSGISAKDVGEWYSANATLISSTMLDAAAATQLQKNVTSSHSSFDAAKHHLKKPPSSQSMLSKSLERFKDVKNPRNRDPFSPCLRAGEGSPETICDLLRADSAVLDQTVTNEINTPDWNHDGTKCAQAQSQNASMLPSEIYELALLPTTSPREGQKVILSFPKRHRKRVQAHLEQMRAINAMMPSPAAIADEELTVDEVRRRGIDLYRHFVNSTGFCFNRNHSTSSMNSILQDNTPPSSTSTPESSPRSLSPGKRAAMEIMITRHGQGHRRKLHELMTEEEFDDCIGENAWDKGWGHPW